MPTKLQNRQIWSAYTWPDAGDEWSVHFGGTPAMWLRVVLPRIQAFLPAHRILEIGPGFGRWSQYLVEACEELFLVDVAPKCVEACRERFRDEERITCYLNSGSGLEMIADGCLDFVFSFDSLVHAEGDAIRGYVFEFARALSEEGVGWIHHSNLEEPLPDRERSGSEPHGRAGNMSATRFREFCAEVDLFCFAQEVIDWGGIPASDCISLVARAGSRWAEQPYRRRDDADFMGDAERTRQLAEFYGPARS